MFNIKKPITIKINILNLIIKACFSQKYKNKQHLIIYLLKKLLLAKQNYSIYNKKLLIIVVLLEIQRVQIKTVLKSNIYINYKNFFYFMTIKQLK